MNAWPTWITGAPADGTHLYRLFGGNGALLYIGLSSQPRSRLKQHWRRQPWRDEVVSSSFQPLGRAGEGEIPGLHYYEDEARAIASERPKYNVAGVTRPYWVYDL